ncbi:MAG: EAL domain-containing protein [Proteobacteria bacterium]|nr:EAL domain-containing protein [Pseudomonadota bacterium]
MNSDTEKLIRLLIVGEGLHEAEQITSSLRAAGIQVRAEFADDDETMGNLLANKSLDLVLFSNDLPYFTLKQAQHLIRECGRHVALISMAKNPTQELIVQSISEGAQDLVSSADLEHLILVIKREAYSLSLWRKAMRMELQIQESENRCQSLLANSRDAVAYVHEGMHIFANEAYMELFGCADFEELEGTPIIDMVDPSQQSELKKSLRDLGQNESNHNELTLKLLNSSGETLTATLEFSKASYDGERCTQILIRSRADTSELEEQINYLHQHDVITGLLNRQHFMGKLKSSITLAMNGIHQSAIVYIAIDDFQSVRDKIGISGCDTLIGEIANILKDNATEQQIVARFGAYSYACLGIIKDKSLIEKFAEDIVTKVAAYVFEIGDQSISVTCSASVCFIDQNSPADANEIISRAEKTCDEIQKVGGGDSSTYIPKEGEMTKEEEDGFAVDVIKEALAKNRIKALYQPIVSIKAEGGERYLSSLELTTKDGETLYRDDYQGAAERTGTAKALDRWMILHAIKKISETRKKSRKIEFFILLSGDSVIDTSLAKWITESLGKAKVSGEQLVFMINEAHAVSHLKAAKALSEGLKQIHCRFALDEFGTGLNPFQLAKHINPDYIRVNPAYMENLAQNEDNQQSIRELSHQAMSTEIRTITPGVEDADILSVLWTLGIDFVQGNFLQKPEKLLNYDFTSM